MISRLRRWWSRRGIRKRALGRPPSTGIEIFIGRPGAGKSLVGVKRVLDAARIQRRVVYTNLPFRWRVVRLYLHQRGGAQLANLIRPLTEAHFAAFLDRFAARNEYVQRRKSEGVLLHDAMREWVEVGGPDVVEGDGANWIPVGSVLAIDEVQAWTGNPAIRSGFKPEPPHLLTYLTMHRHLQHWVWIFTQAGRQVSASWKTLAERYWDVCDMADERVAWYLRWRHLGLKALRYRCYSAGEWDEARPGEPMATFVLFPNMWFGAGWMFRLYDSFTHAGKSKELKAELERERQRAGLSADGSIVSEAPVMAEVSSSAPSVRRGWRVAALRFVRRWFLRLLVLGVIVLSAYGAGRGGRPPERDVIEDPMAALVPVLDVRMVGAASGAALMSDGLRVAKAARWNKGTVLHVAADGLVLAGDDGMAYRWMLGGVGRPICPVGDLCRVVERLGSGGSGAPFVGSSDAR